MIYKTEELGINIHTLLYIENEQSTGSSTQYPAIILGKESEKECIYVPLNHSAVYLKLRQHCKPTILKFFKKKFKEHPLC